MTGHLYVSESLGSHLSCLVQGASLHVAFTGQRLCAKTLATSVAESSGIQTWNLLDYRLKDYR
jgi:hypothetical protein